MRAKQWGRCVPIRLPTSGRVLGRVQRVSLSRPLGATVTLRIPGGDSPLRASAAKEEANKAESMKNDVFVSYASQDAAAAEVIVAALEARGLKCFIAPRDIPAGMEWATAIIDAIFETKLFLLLFSA